MTSRWLLVAVLALVGGCTDFCEGDTVTSAAFAPAQRYAAEITRCIQQQRCEALCAAVFQVDGQVTSCTVASAQRNDLTVQNSPIPTTIDVRTLRGLNLRVVYVQRVACSSAHDTAYDDGDWGDDDGGYDDGGDPCDDGSCDGGGDPCDDGSCDGGGDDGGGDDGGGDDGGGDDGGGGGDGLTGAGSPAHR